MSRLSRAIAVVALAVALLLPTVAGAAQSASLPLPEYVARIAEARAAVEDALPRVTDPAVADELGVTVRDLVVSVESVTVSGRDVPVEQGTLSSLVVKLESAESETTRREAADVLLAHLRSQELALGAEGTPPAGDAAVLERILSEEGTVAPDARARFTERLQRLFEKVLEWLDRAMGAKAARTTFRTVYYVLLVVSLLVVAWLIFVLVRRIRSAVVHGESRIAASSDDAVIAAAEGLPDDALAFADAEAAAGRYRDAVRALFGGVARELVERGIVPRTRTRTDGELLADVALARPAVLPALSELCGAFEPAWYGHIDPGADGYAAARAVYSELVATLGGGAE